MKTTREYLEMVAATMPSPGAGPQWAMAWIELAREIRAMEGGKAPPQSEPPMVTITAEQLRLRLIEVREQGRCGGYCRSCWASYGCG